MKYFTFARTVCAEIFFFFFLFFGQYMFWKYYFILTLIPSIERMRA